MTDILKRNNVRVFGKGTKPVLFAHGFGCGQQMWRHIWSAFENDYLIVLFDYVGSGSSDVNAYNKERYNSLNGYAEDVLDICAELGLKDVIFVGHSVSSVIGMLASIKKPEYFDKLVLVGPSPRYINDQDYTGGFEHGDIVELLETMDSNYIGWANFLGPAIMKNPERPELAAELTDSFCSTDPVIARQFAQVTFLSDNRRDLRHVGRPCLILQCSDDTIAPVSVGHYIYQQLPESKLVIMEATGHCPHLSAPQETISQMQQFLAQD
jgi:sigma-B regulation protein RsbQ